MSVAKAAGRHRLLWIKLLMQMLTLTFLITTQVSR